MNASNHSSVIIAVTGANGQLGQELRQLENEYSNFCFHFFSKEELDITDKEQVDNVMRNLQPHYIINAAAYTAVDKAETEPTICYKINSEAVGFLANIAEEINAKFIHISTDYVFDGQALNPYLENSRTNPQTVYGKSKLAGEEQVFLNTKNAIVIRTSWVYSFFGKNFVKTLMRLMQERSELGVVNDQKGSPTYAADLAKAILEIINKTAANYSVWQSGIFHYSHLGEITWYEFAKAIQELAGYSCKINPISTAQYPTPAKRPAYSVLDSKKMNTVYQLPIYPWKERLLACISLLKHA